MSAKPTDPRSAAAPSSARGDAHVRAEDVYADDIAAHEAHRLGGSSLTPPAGMRDLLPPESRARRCVSEQLQGVFDRSGYELVTTPMFEAVEVFERGLTLDPRDLLRFVEPDSGDVSALRPDITPQIARVVSTRLADYPPPFRIRYEGTVFRRRRGRARRQRQIAQVGVELIGLAGVDADLEVIRLICEACRNAGLQTFRLELAEVGVGRALLAEHGPELLARVAEPLARKDEARLEAALAAAGVSSEARKRITALAHLHGDVSVLKEAKKLVTESRAVAHLDSLSRLTERLVGMGLGPQIGVDLGEIRGAAYYTGVSFALFAPGPGEAVASGGRYDELLGRYGAPQPATGAAIDLENLLWALDRAGLGWRDRATVRFLVSGADAQLVEQRAQMLRAAGFTAATLPDGDQGRATSFARAWGYDVCLLLEGTQATATRANDGAKQKLADEVGPAEFEALAQWARASRKE